MFGDLLRRLRLDVSALSDALQSLIDSPIANGKLVRATMAASTSSVTVLHGLGRAANGALFVSLADTGRTYAVSPVTTVDSVTVSASGSPSSDVEILLWVF